MTTKKQSGLHKTPGKSVSVTETTHGKLKKIATERGVTMDALIAWMLDREEMLS